MKRIERWSLRYYVLRYFLYIIYRLTHRNLIVTGLVNIPSKKPVILAPNHQNALMDALAIVFSAPYEIVYLARADIFRGRIVMSLLNFFKILPIYRIRDGKGSLERNQEIFDICVRILKDKKIFCVFPEAAHTNIKSILPHKKAIPRIVFQTGELTNFELDIQIVPVGIYYTHYYNFRRDLIVNYGEPISVKPYYDILNEKGENEATRILKDKIFEEQTKLCVHVPDRDSYDLYDQSFELLREKACEKLNLENRPRNFVKAEQYIISRLKKYFENDEKMMQDLSDTASSYIAGKKELKIIESSFKKIIISTNEIVFFIFLALILSPVILVGTIINGAIFWITRYSYRSKIKDPQFYSTYSFVASIIVYPLWYILLFFVFWILMKSWWLSVLLIIISIPCGIVAFEMYQYLLRILNRIKYKRLRNQGNYDLFELLRKRNKLISRLGTIIE